MAGMVWLGNEANWFRTDGAISDILRTVLQPLAKFRQFAEPTEADKPYNSGDTFYWNIYGDTAAPAETLDEQQPIPETDFTITQSSLTINEAGIQVAYTAKSETLARHEVVTIIEKALSNNARKWFDASAFTQFNATPLVVQAASGTSTTSLTVDTDGVTAVTNNIEFGKEHLNLIDDLMRERNIPPDPRTGGYIATAHPTTFRSLKDDLEATHIYTTEGINRVFDGEMGRYSGWTFVEQTNIPKGGAEDSTTFNAFTNTADPWDNLKSSWAFFFGGDTVLECMVIPEEVRGKIPTDFGRSKAVAWYYLGGFGLVHTVAANARIAKWDSAA